MDEDRAAAAPAREEPEQGNEVDRAPDAAPPDLGLAAAAQPETPSGEEPQQENMIQGVGEAAPRPGPACAASAEAAQAQGAPRLPAGVPSREQRLHLLHTLAQMRQALNYYERAPRWSPEDEDLVNDWYRDVGSEAFTQRLGDRFVCDMRDDKLEFLCTMCHKIFWDKPENITVHFCEESDHTAWHFVPNCYAMMCSTCVFNLQHNLWCGVPFGCINCRTKKFHTLDMQPKHLVGECNWPGLDWRAFEAFVNSAEAKQPSKPNLLYRRLAGNVPSWHGTKRRNAYGHCHGGRAWLG